jgi:transcriptional regulator with XRE-family HTH domain
MSSRTSSFGELLRKMRTEAALSQEALAERAGVSPRGISDLERGIRRTPHLSTVSMLADALDLGPEDRQAHRGDCGTDYGIWLAADAMLLSVISADYGEPVLLRRSPGAPRPPPPQRGC